MEENEVSRWLGSISNGLNLQLFADDFEARGFTTIDSMKYVEASDLDVFFPSPRKLSYAQKKILLKEIERLPNNTTTQAENSSTSSIETTVANHTSNKPAVEYFPQATPPTGFLNRREEDLTGDMEFLQTRIVSAKNELTRLRHKAIEYDEKAPKRGKSCSNCHLQGHTKGNCRNPPCAGISSCNLQSKHPEFKSEMAELQGLVKDLEKRQQKSKSDILSFKAAREKAANSFFAVMRPRLKKQDAMKYAGTDRIVLDRDLLTLRKALCNKIPVNENEDWKLPMIIEGYKNNMVSPLQGVLDNSLESSSQPVKM